MAIPSDSTEKDKQITRLVWWVVVLIGIALALLTLSTRGHDATGPEWSGATRVDGRG